MTYNAIRNQEQFVKRLVNAQSHFGHLDVSERLEYRDKVIALKTYAKKFQVQGKDADKNQKLAPSLVIWWLSDIYWIRERKRD